jgi:hypothetical protein
MKYWSLVKRVKRLLAREDHEAAPWRKGSGKCIDGRDIVLK